MYFYPMECYFSLEDIGAAALQCWQQSGMALQKPGVARVMAFYGVMGAGKTTFIKALCAAKGVKDTVSSPTFSIINEYRYPDEKGNPQSIYHIDLYRVKSVEEAVQAGIEDCLYSNAICLVEWPERAASLLPPETISIYINAVAEEKRKIRMIKTP